MLNNVLILTGKIVSKISSFLNLGSGSTWPGHIAFSVNKNFVKYVLNQNPHLKIILIAGTNGKTTTGKMIQTILEHAGKRVFQNESGANLLNGIASSIVLHSRILCDLPYDFAIFEVDENTLPLALNTFTPDYLILLNLFRDQLDRYGEVDTIGLKWQKAMKQLNNRTVLLLNADDPQIAYLGTSTKAKVVYFGLDETATQTSFLSHAVDSTFCPKCGTKLIYKTIYFSHLGDWKCNSCNFARSHLVKLDISFFPLPGTYNKYNTLAAVLLAKINNVSNETMEQSLKHFAPAFGRQEIIKFNGKKIQIFLSKNPTSFNESLRTIYELDGEHVLFVLNDRIPDGRDISWIWDTDIEQYIKQFKQITVSGDRAYDMALRIKYSQNFQFPISNFQFEEDLKKAISLALNHTTKTETLYILPTYSAMLEVRKILTGRKIL